MTNCDKRITKEYLRVESNGAEPTVLCWRQQKQRDINKKEEGAVMNLPEK